MGRSDDVISLTREVVSSYETRLKGIGQLVTDTNTLLGDFRKEDVERKKNTAKLLGDFRADHEEMSARLKADLASGEAERVKQAQTEIKERIDQITKLLGDFRADHEEMSARLKTDLAKVGPELTQAEAGRVKQSQTEIEERMGQVTKLLGDFRADHEEMSARLKADLASGEAGRTKQAQIEINERVTSVRELLDEFKTERDKTATAWQGLMNVMQAKRGMAAPPVAEPAKEEAVAEGVPVEMATAETEANEALDESEAMSDQVFAYLADHPDGTRMTELEEEFGVARIKMARLLKELMNENKAEKRDMLYFVI